MQKVNELLADVYFEGIRKNITACWNIYERECSFNEDCYVHLQTAAELAFKLLSLFDSVEQFAKFSGKLIPVRVLHIENLYRSYMKYPIWNTLNYQQRLENAKLYWLSIRREIINHACDGVPICQANEKLLEAEKTT